jgi:transcriptional regulator with XRE-family HTH domain
MMKPKNDLQERIAKNIKKLRGENGWTQDDLATRLSVGRTAIAKYESCARTPTTYQLHQLASIFGVTVDTLMQ